LNSGQSNRNCEVQAVQEPADTLDNPVPFSGIITLYLHIDAEKLIWVCVVLAACIDELKTFISPQVLLKVLEEIFSYIYWHFLIKSILQIISASLFMVLYLKARFNFE
jgi:hypothetical protein